MLFGFGSNQDFGDATQVIAFAGAGGLGLPDRDYYMKTDAKSQEIRGKYVEHVARMLRARRRARPRAAADAKTRDGDRDRAGQGLARRASSGATRTSSTTRWRRAELAKLTPSFDWDAYLAASGLGDVATLNVTEPTFFKEVETELKAVPLARWKTYLRWHVVDARAPYLSPAFVDEDFDFYRKTLRGVAEHAPALEALRPLRRPRPGRGARPGVRAPHVHRGDQGRRPSR